MTRHTRGKQRRSAGANLARRRESSPKSMNSLGFAFMSSASKGNAVSALKGRALDACASGEASGPVALPCAAERPKSGGMDCAQSCAMLDASAEAKA